MFSKRTGSLFLFKEVRKILRTRQFFTSEKLEANPPAKKLPVYDENESMINDDKKFKKKPERISYISEDLLNYEKNINRRTKTSNTDFKEVIYGLHPVQLALQCRRRAIYQLYIQDKFKDSNATIRKKIIELAHNLKIPITEVKKSVLQKLSKNHVHQGVCLDVSEMHTEDIDECIREDNTAENKIPPVWLILDQIQDPMNFGAILRSSYYFGIDKVCTVKDNSCKLSPVVSKASSGALEVFPVYLISNLPEFLQIKKDSNWHIIGTASYSEDICSKSIGIHTLKLTRPTICILGNEGVGMSKQLYDICDNIVTIFPGTSLHSGIDSLNVSVVCGVILHQLNLIKMSS